MEGRELRRSVTLLEQLSAVDSSSLGDLLKIREEDDLRLSRRRCVDSVTLESIIECVKRESLADSCGGGGRTLLDIILQEHETNGIMADGNSSSSAAWKTLRDRLLLDRAGTTCAAECPSHPHPISDFELMDSTHPRPVSVSHSVSVQNSELAVPEPTVVATTAVELPSASEGGSSEINSSEDSDPGGAAESLAPAAAPDEEEPTRVSLMALLEQTDRQWGGSGREGLSLVAAMAEEVAEDEVESGGGVMLYLCCVCMVRHKGAAFIPCGHTFCRLCSREIWVSRGSCPLCNGHILEILDIF